MRKHIPLALAGIVLGTLLSVHPAFAAGWHQLTSATTEGLNGVDCGTASACIAVGNAGAAVYTTNSTTWSSTSTGVSTTLRDVDMTSSTVGFAVGDSGTILKTTNGGATWTTQTSGSSEQLYDIFMVSSTVGYIVGEDATLLKTTNGSTWTDIWTITSGMSSTDMRSIDAASVTVVWISGKIGTIYRSADGGSSWTDVSYATGETVHAIDALTSTSAIASGANGLLIKTTDSGSTWSALSLPAGFSSTDTIVDLSFWTSTAGTVAGDGGTIASTSNGGSAWTDDTDDYASGIAFADTATPSVGVRYAVGADGFVALYDNYGPSAPTNLTVDDDATDADYTKNLTPTLTWTASTDTEGSAISYEYRIDGSAYAATSSVTSHTFSALGVGPHSVELRALDTFDNVSDATTRTFIVDVLPPTVDSPTPTTATTGVSTTYSVTSIDTTSGVDVCTLYRGTTAVASMTGAGVVWSAAVTTSTAGTYSMYATCYDFAGNSTTGTSSTLVVTGTSTTTTTEETDVDSDEAVPGDLIKLACDADADVNDPCKAVYYFGDDEKRHAFPNEKVYFTWYTDFSHVIIVTDDYMASFMLGRNVTYHPGTKMVKFITVNTVYAVGEDGKLRAINSEETAESIYGSTWNKKIDDISDAFFGNYSFGEVIDSTSDFDPDVVEASVDSIDDIL